MGMITLVFLLAGTIVYGKDLLKTKPEFVGKIEALVNGQIDNIAKWGSAYAAAAALLTLLLCFTYAAPSFLIRLLANLLVIAMFAPKLVEKYSALIEAKGGAQAKKYTDLAVEQIKKNEKYIGYAGAGLSVLLFVAVFN